MVHLLDVTIPWYTVYAKQLSITIIQYCLTLSKV